jgi:hypothetical protein
MCTAQHKRAVSSAKDSAPTLPWSPSMDLVLGRSPGSGITSSISNVSSGVRGIANSPKPSTSTSKKRKRTSSGGDTVKTGGGLRANNPALSGSGLQIT